MRNTDDLWMAAMKSLAQEWREGSYANTYQPRTPTDCAHELDEVVKGILSIITTGDRIREQREYDIHNPKG